MSEEAATLNASANSSGWRDASPAAAPLTRVRWLRLYVRAAAVALSGGFLLASFFALQVAALEVSDRLNIFPLHGLLFINLLCGLCLSYYVVKSRKPSSVRRRAAGRVPGMARRRSIGGWAGVASFLNIPRAGNLTRAKARPAAVLLIIKRRAAGPEIKRRAA
jgi:hypothetical protein